MSIELTMLALSAGLTFVLAFPPVIALVLTKGIVFASGNRDEPYTLPVWGERAGRAYRNMLENFPVFVALVVVVHLSGATNETTALGATLFFWGRVAHAVVYLVGIRYLRTAAFGVSIIGLAMIASQLVPGS
jgi:uncharacterized MAPEG superfamily protein